MLAYSKDLVNRQEQKNGKIRAVTAVIVFLLVLLFLFLATNVLAHLPRVIYNNQENDIEVKDAEISQAFYDELSGKPRFYFIKSETDFILYLNLLVPESTNSKGRYSARVFEIKNEVENEVVFLDGQNFEWQEFYEPFGRDYYLKGPEFEKQMSAGNYKVEVSNDNLPAQAGNTGKYVLVVGKKEVFTFKDISKIYWVLPVLKTEFFKTPVIQLLFSPFGLALIGLASVILFFIAIILFVSFIIEKIRRRKPKILLLTSSGMQGSRQEIMAILPKPADKIRVARIITAAKLEKDISYAEKDKELMKEAGFNVEDFDIEGKTYGQLVNFLKDFDIIFVQGGNSFYLLKQMRMSGFDKAMKKLFKKGIIYIGVSAGSIVAGKSIITAEWLGDYNNDLAYANKKLVDDLTGLNFVPLNIFVHYSSEYAEIIKKQPNYNKKNLAILTDEQSLLINGKEISLIGAGEAIKIDKL